MSETKRRGSLARWAEFVVLLAGLALIVWVNPYRGLFDPYAPPFTTGEVALLVVGMTMVGVPAFAACDRLLTKTDQRKTP